MSTDKDDKTAKAPRADETPKAPPPKAAARAPEPLPEPEPPALDVLAVALAEMYLTAPRSNPQGFGMQPPPSPAECLARAKRFAADLVPHIIHTDRDEIELALRLNAAHGIGAGLCLSIAREWVALRNSITPPE